MSLILEGITDSVILIALASAVKNTVEKLIQYDTRLNLIRKAPHNEHRS